MSNKPSLSQKVQQQSKVIFQNNLQLGTGYCSEKRRNPLKLNNNNKQHYQNL